MTQDQSMQKFTRGTKTTLQVTFAAVAVLMAGTAFYAAATGVALSSTFLAYLANPWAIAIIVSVAAVYLIAAAYQQWHLIEGTPGKDGVNGKDADFSALLGDAVKGAKIVEKEVTENGSQVKKLFLELSSDNRKVLLGEKAGGKLYVIFKGENGQYVSQSFAFQTGGKNKDIFVDDFDFAEVRKALCADEKATSLKVVVSDRDINTLKESVAPNLQDVVVNAAITKATGK